MLRVDVGGDPASALGIGDDVETERRLTARLRTVYLRDSTAGNAAHADRSVEIDGAGGNRVDAHPCIGRSHLHDRALAAVLFDLRNRQVQRLFLVVVNSGYGRYSPFSLTFGPGFCRSAGDPNKIRKYDVGGKDSGSNFFRGNRSDSSLISVKKEGVLDVFDPHCVFSNNEPDGVELDGIAGALKSRDPNLRRTAQLPLLPPVHGTDRSCKGIAGSRLHFVERD